MLLPNMIVLPNWLDSALTLLVKALGIFPIDVFGFVILNITFWLSCHMLWAIIEWLYHKIPGIS